MEQQLYDVFQELLNIDFIDATLSNSTDKEQLTKIKIRPVLLKKQLLFQMTKYIGKQVFHENMTKDELVQELDKCLFGGGVVLKQGEFHSKTQDVTFLISKKGKVTVKRKKTQAKPMELRMDLSHNRAKQYILREGMCVPFLVDLGVMSKDGKIINAKYDKFKQINRFLEFIEDVLPNLSKDRELTILDFGCGKSYLTFAMYYYLHEMKQYNIRIIGLDLKKEVIRNCNQLSQKYGYEKLVFLEGDIADYEGVSQVDMVVTLHACDTATDYALYKAIKWGAKVILSVPCCQHEMNQNMHAKEWNPVFKYGIVKERAAALFTDALRANLLESQGYKTQILEFIDLEHTPKNLLIRGVKNDKGENCHKSWQAYENMVHTLGCDITLGKLLKEEE